MKMTGPGKLDPDPNLKKMQIRAWKKKIDQNPSLVKSLIWIRISSVLPGGFIHGGDGRCRGDQHTPTFKTVMSIVTIKSSEMLKNKLIIFLTAITTVGSEKPAIGTVRTVIVTVRTVIGAVGTVFGAVRTVTRSVRTVIEIVRSTVGSIKNL